ncbi:hypothetical protein PENSPDRAFT_636617 [Peniophora sp. CONT]|nr:hypothetical protein PENSPDRAFT_636617 [Peniophora sp. CONT]
MNGASYDANHLAESYVRMAMIGIACYDYIRTIPDEIAIYRDCWQKRKERRIIFPHNVILFVLIRYVSGATIAYYNATYFLGLSEEMCVRTHRIPITLKLLQTIVSQIIIGLRTYTLARYSKRVKYFMLAIFFVTCGLEAFSNYFRRVLLWHDRLCTTGNLPGLMFTFTYYLWAVLYDICAISIATYYLFSLHLETKSLLIRQMLLDGLGYLVVLTAINLTNLIFYLSAQQYLQVRAITVGITFTWILSQGMIIHTRKAARAPRTMSTIGPTDVSTFRIAVPHHDTSDSGNACEMFEHTTHLPERVRERHESVQSDDATSVKFGGRRSASDSV